MKVTTNNLSDMIGSRICHDLISPIGAISNGVELITMDGSHAGPELNLISESVENANAKIRFFRIAFGAAQANQRIGQSEVTKILRDSSKGSRVVLDWTPTAELDRSQVKLAFLLLMCFESAMPWGGRVKVSSVGDQWAIHGQADQIKIDPELWSSLSNPEGGAANQPSEVHFALAALWASEMGRTLRVESSDGSLRIRF